MRDSRGYAARPPEIQAAGDAVAEVAGRVQQIDLRSPLHLLAQALPGGSAANAARICTLGSGVHSWSERARAHSQHLHGAGVGYVRTDQESGVPFVIGQHSEGE